MRRVIMNIDNRSSFLNISATHKKALKAALKFGFFAGLLGLLGGVFLGSSGINGNVAAEGRLVAEALITGLVIGVMAGLICGTHIWLMTLTRACRRSLA